VDTLTVDICRWGYYPTASHERRFSPYRGGVMNGSKPGYRDGSTRDPAEIVADDYSVAYTSDPGEIVAAFDGLGASFLARLLARPDWMAEAECRGSDVDFTSKGKAERARAFALCSACPVRLPCLAWAYEVGDEAAILGGLDAPARRAHKRAATARYKTRGVA
jgi:WhiB family redox-sensing transcriptional regulator